MALKFKRKKAIVEDVTKVASGAISMVVADYRGLTASEMTSLRAKASSSGVTIKVVRNTLARRALVDTDYECVTDTLNGPVLLAFAANEPGAPAKLLRDFAKENEALEVKSLSLGGKLLDASQLGKVASLPNKEEAIAKLMMVLQAPIVKLAQTVAAPHTKLVRVIAAVKDQKTT